MHVVATAGHVDHGKSTLLRALTGMEPDRWEEERRRGLTIDLGFVWSELAPGVTVAFVDVPGHERFVANMLAGAGGVRLALFVVAADDGWSAQSQEHLDILDLLGVAAAVVAVTKADLAGSDRARQVAADVAARVASTSLGDAPVVIVDGVSGRGLDELRGTLTDRLAAIPPPPDRGRPRLWIDRSFSITGAGTVVTGTLTGGGLQVGQDVLLEPAGRTVRVRSLQMLGRDVAATPPGSRVAVNLSGVDRHQMTRGDALVAVVAGGRREAAGWWTADTVDAWVTALAGHEIGPRGAWHLHVGSADVRCEVHPLLGEPATSGEPAHVRLLLERPLPLVAGDRLVLREAGRQATLGGGMVLDPDPPGRVRGPDARLARVDALERVRQATDPPGRLVALTLAAGGVRDADRLRWAAQVPPDAPPPAGTVEVAGYIAAGDALDGWTRAVQEAAHRHHQADPASRGADRGELADAARRAGCPPVFAPLLVGALAERGLLRRDGSRFALPEHAPAVDEARQQRRAALLAELAEQPFSPPPLDEAARRAGLDHQEVNALVTSGDIVVAGGVGFGRGVVAEAVRRLAVLGPRFTTAEAREALGTTRKYVIPLLEHLDAIGVTEFDGQTRALRRPASHGSTHG